MLQDELRGYEAEQVRNSLVSGSTPDRAGDSGSLRTSRDGGTSWWGGWGNVSNSMNGAHGAARAADLMRTLGALGDPSNPWQVCARSSHHRQSVPGVVVQRRSTIFVDPL